MAKETLFVLGQVCMSTIRTEVHVAVVATTRVIIVRASPTTITSYEFDVVEKLVANAAKRSLFIQYPLSPLHSFMIT